MEADEQPTLAGMRFRRGETTTFYRSAPPEERRVLRLYLADHYLPAERRASAIIFALISVSIAVLVLALISLREESSMEPAADSESVMLLLDAMTGPEL